MTKLHHVILTNSTNLQTGLKRKSSLLYNSMVEFYFYGRVRKVCGSCLNWYVVHSKKLKKPHERMKKACTQCTIITLNITRSGKLIMLTDQPWVVFNDKWHLTTQGWKNLMLYSRLFEVAKLSFFFSINSCEWRKK